MIDLTHKLFELDELLIKLLENLTEEEWHGQTVAKLWTVKDVAAHLLDGNIRILSGLRDGYQHGNPKINSYQDLLDYLNQLNTEWVLAMKRVSPKMLIELLKQTGKPFCDYYASLNLMDEAVFSVAWAGEQESKNWMHIAREYTEKFLHQQQIRDAVGKQGLLTKEFFQPFLDVCMYALPHALRNTPAKEGDALQMAITGEAGGSWFVRYDGVRWERVTEISQQSILTEIIIEGEVSWKLFSKSLRAEDVPDKIQIVGNQELGKIAAQMVSFMA